MPGVPQMLSTHSKEKILVTGASGFLGSNLCRRLMHNGAQVHAVSRTPRNSESGCVCSWQGDMADIGTVRRLLYEIKPDVVFHLAGLSTASPDRELVLPTLHSLLVSTVNILTVSAEIGCRRVVLAGSLTEPQPGLSEITPGSPYAAAKWACGAYARMFYELYRVPVVIVRPFMTYGPGQNERKLIPHVILSFLRGEAPKISSGQQQFDWIFVDDVIDGFLAAAGAPEVEGRTIDLGSGTLVSIRTMVQTLVDLTGSKIDPHLGAVSDRPFEQARTADMSHAYAALNWKPKISLREGLSRTVSWYSQQVADLP
jgi:nucleoside-diphosphate-sugar epimerase